MSSVRNWQGEEWEDFCLLLLSRLYGAHELQRVPARHRGDLGIEAFSFSGHAFQCYAPQEPLSVRERYEKQRDKLTADLAKLERKQAELLILLGDVCIHRYAFMVPQFDSHELVMHASTKSLEYRAKNLPHLHAEFRVVVVTDDNYAETRSQVLKRPQELVDVSVSDNATVHNWMAENELQTRKADEKLRVIIADAQRRAHYLKEIIAQHLEGDNALAALRPKYPDQWEAARRCCYEKERRLVLEHTANPTANGTGMVFGIASELQQELSTQIPDLGQELSRKLAWSTIGDWLLRCPLDFVNERVV